jgi:two-component system chemotaxis response regulator CheY
MTAKILIVDDSALARRTLKKILQPTGCQLSEAADGVEAIERFFLERPDVVLLDLTMEGMEGFEVLRKLREIDAGAQVIVASADIQETTQEIVFAAGASAYLTKPFTEAEVLAALERVLKGGEGASN